MKTIGALLIGASVAGTLSLAVAPASAQPRCPRPIVINVDDGSGVMKGTYRLKAGPFAGSRCRAVATLRRGTVLYFQCWTRNSYGHSWVYARVKGTRTFGWMSADNLVHLRGTRHTMCPIRV